MTNKRAAAAGEAVRGTHQLLNSISKRDGRQDETGPGHPQISQNAVQQFSRPLQSGLEGDSGAKLASEGTPGSLDVGEPQDHVGDVGEPQGFRMPPLHRQTHSSGFGKPQDMAKTLANLSTSGCHKCTDRHSSGF